MFITVIQISSNEATFARFSSQRGNLRFLEGATHQLADTPLTDLLPRWGGTSREDRIILSIPPDSLFMREIELPISDRKKAREALPLELKGETALESDGLIFDLLPLQEGKFLAIWSEKEPLEQLISLLAEQGLEPEFVTSSLFNWQHLVPDASTSPIALTDGNAVAIFSHGRPLYMRTLSSSVENSLSVTLTAFELSRDISVTEIFSFGTTQIPDTNEQWAPLPMNGKLTGCFNTDTIAAQDLAGLFATALETCAGEPVNLRRGTLIFRKRHAELLRKLRWTGILAATLLLLLFVEAGLRFYLVRRDVVSLDRSILTIYREAFPKRLKPVDEVGELRAEIKRLGAASSEGILNPLRKLAESKGDELNDLYEVEIDGNQVSGKGSARSTQGVNDFKTKSARLFGSFEVSEIRSRPDGSTGFSFRGTLKEVGK